MKEIRLNKYLASCGIASRRAAEKLMEAGRVKVNGIVVREMGIKIEPGKDKVVVGEIQVQPKEERVYYLLNKPQGYVCSSFDPLRRKRAVDLVPREPRVFTVGRLDKDTRGLLILTNDGGLAYKLTHPKFEKEKQYEVKCKMQNEKCKTMESLRDVFLMGIELKEGLAKADEIEVLEEKGDLVKLRIVIHQGWKRQIRRMCEAVGLEVQDLQRVRLGDLELGELKEGEWRKLTAREVSRLFK